MKDVPAGSGKPAAPVKRLLIIELEGAVESLRERLGRALSASLPDHPADAIETALIRYGSHPSPRQAAAAILAGLGVRASVQDKALKAVDEAVASFYDSDNCALRPAAKAAIEAFRQLGGGIALLSCLGAEVVEALAKRLGLDSDAVLFTMEAVEDKVFPTTDQWAKVARAMGCPPCRTTVLVSSQSACKSAMTAGFRCLAAPDRFTVFQDFGGADAVLAPDAAVTAKTLLGVL